MKKSPYVTELQYKQHAQDKTKHVSQKELNANKQAPAYPPQDESKSNSGPKVRQGQEKTQRQAHEAQADPRTGENTCSPPLQKQPAEGVAPLRDLVVNTCTASDSYDGARPGTGKGHADEAKAEAAENPSSEPKNHQTRGSKVSRDAMGRDSTRPGGMAADAKANPTTGEISESSKVSKDGSVTRVIGLLLFCVLFVCSLAVDLRRSEERNAINEALDMLESDDETPMP
eukprot:1148283-Amorphochlora_amoeboformis.AAC.3